jgi:predicted dinucleotide-binding enzyme
MKIGILGTGMVGTTIGSKLVALGHHVTLGSREAGNEKGAAWAAKAGANASHGTFATAAAEAEVLFNCTNGGSSVAAIEAAGAANVRGKVLVDVANPLDFSRGMPPTLLVANNDSLGERIQKAFPEAKVVKALNTVNCEIMVNPGRLSGDTDTFVCGNDADAKARVAEILRGFGWKSVVDLGDITAARGVEAYLLLWIRMMGAVGTPHFNVKIVR